MRVQHVYVESETTMLVKYTSVEPISRTNHRQL